MSVTTPRPSMFDIRPGEGRLVSLLFALFFSVGMGLAFTRTLAYTQFLHEFSSNEIPYIYIWVGVITALAMTGYLRISRRLSLARVAMLIVVTLLVVQSVLHLLVVWGDAQWVALALPIWYESAKILLSLVAWALAGQLVNLRQGKRLLGLAGSGFPLANLVAGLLTPPAVFLLGPDNLMVVSSIFIALCLVLVILLARMEPVALGVMAAEPVARARTPRTSLLHDPYIVLIFALCICWTLSFHFVDNLFLERLNAQFEDKVSLANFLGIYSAVVGLFTFLSGALLTAPFLNRFGVKVGAYALPVTLAVCILPFLVTGSIWGLVPFLFWPAFAAKVLDYAVDPIDRATRTILYQPISEHLRVRVQMITEGILRPLVTGLASIILLFITVIFGLNAIFIGYALLGILLIWMVVAKRMSGAYPAMLMQALVRRRLGEVELTLDKASVDVLLRSLDTPHADAVIFAVEQLEDQNHPALAGALVRLLDHPSPLVRSDMLARIERLHLLEALPALRRLATGERDRAVRSALFCTLAALGTPDEITHLAESLTDEDLAVRQGVATGLLLHGNAAGKASARAALREWHASAHPPQRALVAAVAGATGDEEATAVLGSLLQDSDRSVQLAAMEAVAHLRDGRYWSLIVDKLDDAEFHQAAQNTLVAGGGETFAAVADALRRPDLSASLLLRLATLCGRLQIPALSELLAVHSEFADVTVRRHILVALQRAEYHAEGDRAEQYLKQIEDEVLTVAWTMAAIRDLDGDDSVRLLQSALELELQHQTVRLLCLLSFVVDARSVRQAQQTLTSPRSTGRQRAIALEVLELVTPQSVKSLILPVIDDVPLVQRLRKLGDRYRHPPLPLPARLREVMAGARRLSEWSIACTTEAIGRLDLPLLADVIPDVLANPALARRPLVREAALLAGSRPASPNPLTGPLAEERSMLSTFEKVLILKSVSIFDRVPDDALAVVATAFQEQEVVDGALIFAKGDPASAMYIIVVGSVSVHDGAHTLNQLGPREVFGEMALFDAEARSASVSALGDTLLLRLDQEAFLELLDDHSAISLGIIRVLSQRLRARTEDLSRLRAGLPVAGA